jgi:predicted  nucleic acid-binding Zn-ribbon protein
VSREELDSLRRELERTRQELEKARRGLDEERLKSSQETERLLTKKMQAAAAGNADETRRLENQLKEREAELEKRRQQVAQFEKANEEYRTRLSRVEGESASLRQELDAARKELAKSQREIEDKKNAAAEAERRLAATQQEIARAKSAQVPADPARVKALEAEVEKSRNELARQKEDLARLETNLGGYRDKVARLEARPAAAAPKTAVAMAAPTIQIIDPQVVLTRDTATVKVRSGLATRPLVGRVTAPGGLLSFTANDVAQELDDDGYFKTNVNLGGGKTRVSMVAVDRQGKRAALEFFLEEDAKTGKAAVVPPPRFSGQSLGLGKYYALVIGNQKYEKLAKLNTPEADATEIARVLRDRYGFTVTILLNANRFQMMEELNKMRALLTEKDNLLIYYAGHGQIDRVNQLANWLPIDADEKSNANWIANSTLTETLNTMSAKAHPRGRRLVLLRRDDPLVDGHAAAGPVRRGAAAMAQIDRRLAVANRADQRRRRPRHGRRRRQAFGVRAEFHRRTVRQSGRDAGQAVVGRDRRARAERGAEDEFRPAARVRADPLRRRRVRRFHLHPEDLTR